MKESIRERELVVHKIALDREAVGNIIGKIKTKFFARLSLFKPRQEEIECELLQPTYEPFITAKASYLLDYYKKKTYAIKIDEEVKEVDAFGQTFKPESVKEGILKRPYKAIFFAAQERAIRKATVHLALNRKGREVDPAKLPSGSIELEPKKTLKEADDRVRDLEISPDTILDKIRKRTAKRPSDVCRIAEEAFEVTEYALVCTPVYEARCRRPKTGEIKVIPISAVTGNVLLL